MAFEEQDFTDVANVRVAFDVWPTGRPLPTTVDEVAQGALGLLLGRVLADRGATLNLVRLADDGASIWLIDPVPGITVEDLVRSVAQAFDPPAFALAAMQPMRAPGDPTVRGVHLRACHGDTFLELTGQVQGAGGPVPERRVPGWAMRRGEATSDVGRWIGVKPTVEVRLPMLGVADA